MRQRAAPCYVSAGAEAAEQGLRCLRMCTVTPEYSWPCIVLLSRECCRRSWPARNFWQTCVPGRHAPEDLGVAQSTCWHAPEQSARGVYRRAYARMAQAPTECWHGRR